jgi:hypothetical protein
MVIVVGVAVRVLHLDPSSITHYPVPQYPSQADPYPSNPARDEAKSAYVSTITR